MATSLGMRSGSYLEDPQQAALQAKMVILGDSRTGKTCLVNSLDSVGVGGGSGGKKLLQLGGRNLSVIDSGAAGVSVALPEVENEFFSVVEFPAHELDSAASSVYLKMWEYTHDLSKEEEELVFRGALFCVITLDLRSPDSANSAFNKWLTLKEAQMGESFLFVVGTFLDQSISRRVEIAELCKACAQRDAIYIEVSNLDGSNVSLLRRLIAQRINYMLRVRETVARQALPHISNRRSGRGVGGTTEGGEDDDDETTAEDDAVGESKHATGQRPSIGTAGGTSRRDSALKTAFLEQEIVCDSVGSILASCLGTEFWPGYEQEEENLRQIGEKINDYVHRIAIDPASAPSTPLEHVLHSSAPPPQPPLAPAAPAAAAPEPDLDELRHVFEIMGFELPESLLQTASNSAGPRRAVATAMRSTKLRVKLPSGETADMVLYPGYHVGQQVDAFLVQHDMQDDDEAKIKLFEAAQSIVAAAAREHDKHEDEDEEHQRMHAMHHQAMASLSASPPRLAAGTASFHTGASGSRGASVAGALGSNVGNNSHHQPLRTGRRCRVRIALPSSMPGAPGQTIETVMNENEDLVALSKRIGMQHGLSLQFQEKVLQQLRAAFK